MKNIIKIVTFVASCGILSPIHGAAAACAAKKNTTSQATACIPAHSKTAAALHNHLLDDLIRIVNEYNYDLPKHPTWHLDSYFPTSIRSCSALVYEPTHNVIISWHNSYGDPWSRPEENVYHVFNLDGTPSQVPINSKSMEALHKRAELRRARINSYPSPDGSSRIHLTNFRLSEHRHISPFPAICDNITLHRSGQSSKQLKEACEVCFVEWSPDGQIVAIGTRHATDLWTDPCITFYDQYGNQISMIECDYGYASWSLSGAFFAFIKPGELAKIHVVRRDGTYYLPYDCGKHDRIFRVNESRNGQRVERCLIIKPRSFTWLSDNQLAVQSGDYQGNVILTASIIDEQVSATQTPTIIHSAPSDAMSASAAASVIPRTAAPTRTAANEDGLTTDGMSATAITKTATATHVANHTSPPGGLAVEGDSSSSAAAAGAATTTSRTTTAANKERRRTWWLE